MTESTLPETNPMGRVVVEATIENLNDLTLVHLGQLTKEGVRRLVVPDAIIDTGATGLSMPRAMIEGLGLIPYRDRPTRTAGGKRVFKVYGMVRLNVQGRECHVEASEIDDECPVLIGQIPLEIMDWVVDCKNQRLIGNPEHGGEWVQEMY